MIQYDSLSRLLYGAIGPAARLVSRILPEGVHPGLSAYRVVASLGLAPGRTCFAAAVLESYLRALLLQRHVAALPADELHRFAATCIDYKGPTPPSETRAGAQAASSSPPHTTALRWPRWSQAHNCCNVGAAERVLRQGSPRR